MDHESDWEAAALGEVVKEIRARGPEAP